MQVRDVARAFDVVLHQGMVGQVYNIGTQKERSVLDVVRTIADHLNVPDSKIKHVEDRAFNDQRCATLAGRHFQLHVDVIVVFRCCCSFDSTSVLLALLPSALYHCASWEGAAVVGIALAKVLLSACVSCRYYICDKKLLALGWKEEETWKEGLTETIDWCADQNDLLLLRFL